MYGIRIVVKPGVSKLPERPQVVWIRRLCFCRLPWGKKGIVNYWFLLAFRKRNSAMESLFFVQSGFLQASREPESCIVLNSKCCKFVVSTSFPKTQNLHGINDVLLSLWFYKLPGNPKERWKRKLSVSVCLFSESAKVFWNQ